MRIFWNIFGAVYVTLLTAALVGLAWYSVVKIFEQSTAPGTVRQAMISSAGETAADGQEQNIPAASSEPLTAQAYSDTYQLFNSQFTQLLTMFGIFGALFGIALPAGAYLLQRQSLKDERESINESIKEKVVLWERELKKSKQEVIADLTMQTQNLIADTKSELQRLHEEQYFGLGMASEASLPLYLFYFRTTSDPGEKIVAVMDYIVALDAALNWFCKGKHMESLNDLIEKGIAFLEFVQVKHPSIFNDVIAKLKADSSHNQNYVKGTDIKDGLGPLGMKNYLRFKAIFEPIYPWKFED